MNILCLQIISNKNTVHTVGMLGPLLNIGQKCVTLRTPKIGPQSKLRCFLQKYIYGTENEEGCQVCANSAKTVIYCTVYNICRINPVTFLLQHLFSCLISVSKHTFHSRHCFYILYLQCIVYINQLLSDLGTRQHCRDNLTIF